jgi:serine/threonine protein kinase
MGCIASQPSFIASSNGTLDDYQKRYLETKTLGEGEFGVVKLAHDVTDKDLVSSKPLAVKYLRKGFQFKDNTLYSPIKKDVLVGEVEILRRLNGECYNLKVERL